jgi:hypothetical protein
MAQNQITKSVVGIVSVALSFALGLTLYKAFLVADVADTKKAPVASPKPMKQFSGHGQAVSDNKNDDQRQALNKKMVTTAPSSEMLG